MNSNKAPTSAGPAEYKPPVPKARELIRKHYGLTPRQLDVAVLLFYRRTDDEIASILRISRPTIATHVQTTLLKLGVRNRRLVEHLLRDD